MNKTLTVIVFGSFLSLLLCTEVVAEEPTCEETFTPQAKEDCLEVNPNLSDKELAACAKKLVENIYCPSEKA